MSSRLLQLIESFFRRRFWVVNLIGISIVCFLMARGINGLLAANLARLTVVAPVISQADDDAGALPSDDNALLISELLHVEQPVEEVVEEPPVEEPEEEPAEPEEEPVVIAGDCTQSNIPAILVGTNYDPRGEYLIGVVQDQTANRTVLVRPGMDLVGAQVIDVTRNRVWVYNAGNIQCLKPNEQPNTSLPATPVTPPAAQTEQPAESPPARATARAEPEVSPPSFRGANDLESGVRRVSPTQYEIDRGAIDAAMDNPRMLQSQAPDFQQSFDNGRPSGIRLTRLPAGSVFSAIGIRQGDVIMAVNGQRVTTPQRAMELYEALQNENHVEVTVQRRGRQRTLSYDIR